MPESNRCKLLEIEDEGDVYDVGNSHDRRYNPITELVFPLRAEIEGVVNGLLFLNSYPQSLSICNPITREYIELGSPQRHAHAHGFGASKITKEYKLVSINQVAQELVLDKIIPKLGVFVYTLGTGAWKSVEAVPELNHTGCSSGSFVSGNLYWTVLDSDLALLISCFDLEAERFSALSVPPPLQGRDGKFVDLCVLKDCLCLCDAIYVDEIAIWLMKEHGVEKSWSKEYVIPRNPEFNKVVYELVIPIKVFKDGDMLLLCDDQLLFYYSNKTKTTHRIDIFDEPSSFINSMLLTPSFLSLEFRDGECSLNMIVFIPIC